LAAQAIGAERGSTIPTRNVAPFPAATGAHSAPAHLAHSLSPDLWEKKKRAMGICTECWSRRPEQCLHCRYGGQLHTPLHSAPVVTIDLTEEETTSHDEDNGTAGSVPSNSTWNDGDSDSSTVHFVEPDFVMSDGGDFIMGSSDTDSTTGDDAAQQNSAEQVFDYIVQ